MFTRKTLALFATVPTLACHPNGAIPRTVTKLEPPALERFAVSLSASGSLQPGQPTTITASAVGIISTRSVEIVVYAPDLRADKINGLRAATNGRFAGLPLRFEGLPPEEIWQTELPAGERFHDKTSLVIQSPGYYRVMVTVLKESSEPDEVDGRAVSDVAHAELWLWVADKGGRITRGFDRRVFPRAVRQQPGPLCLKTTPWCRMTEERARVSGWFANIPTLAQVSVNGSGPQLQMLKSARFDISVSDRDSTRLASTTGSNFWYREYRISAAGDLHVSVHVTGEAPHVVAQANATIHLRPDLHLWVRVYAWSPSMNPLFYGCRCRRRLAFPLQTEAPTADSLIIAWDWETLSRPNPPS